MITGRNNSGKQVGLLTRPEPSMRRLSAHLDLGPLHRPSSAAYRKVRVNKRREALLGERSSWKPSRCREAARTLDSLENAIGHADTGVTDLDARQVMHDEFAIEHRPEFDERRLLSRAVSARRLKIIIDAIADPPTAALTCFCPRPESQRDRLRWDNAVEVLVVYAGETGRCLPQRARLPSWLGHLPTSDSAASGTSASLMLFVVSNPSATLDAPWVSRRQARPSLLPAGRWLPGHGLMPP